MKHFFHMLAAFFVILLLSYCNLKGSRQPLPNTPIISMDLKSFPELNKVLIALEKGYRVEGSVLGEGSILSKQWKNYEQLSKIATTGQLIILTNHRSPTVRCYVFQALAARHSSKVFEVLQKHLQDTARIEAMDGCFVWREFTGDYFINIVTSNPIEIDSYTLNRREKSKLDSILRNDKSIVLAAKSELIETDKLGSSK